MLQGFLLWVWLGEMVGTYQGGRFQLANALSSHIWMIVGIDMSSPGCDC